MKNDTRRMTRDYSLFGSDFARFGLISFSRFFWISDFARFARRQSSPDAIVAHPAIS
jgi:hypothetical protein